MKSVSGFIIGAAIALLLFLIFIGVDVLPYVAILALIGIVFYTKSGGISLGTLSSKDMKADETNKVSFDDIGGQDVAKRELKEALDFMKDVDKSKRLGIRPLKGILLTGPPGTGKTMLAKAAASYTDSAFTSISGSAFIEVYAGIGAKRVREAFKSARDLAKKNNKESSVLFIDEIEVLGGVRGKNQGHLEYDQTLNQLLVEMDGISYDEIRVLVIAATNRADLLDDALLRPGRFDRIVNVDMPDQSGRKHILNIHTYSKPLSEDVDIDELASATTGFSGAHLESLANEAAIMSLREGREEIRMSDFREALDKVMLGERLERRHSDDDMYRIAVHEVGHAIVSEVLVEGSVSAITVVSRGRALGFVRQVPTKESLLQTGNQIEDQIAILLSGAISEEIVLGNRSTGAKRDFEQAADLAKFIVEAGMSVDGTKGSIEGATDNSAQLSIIEEQEERAKEIIMNCRPLVDKLVKVLLVEERISGDDFRKLLSLVLPKEE